ncbi:MAG TPA: C45 family peptidase [Pelolinea sp.]|nr:C45 family peptidase [Pelolinea sp.]
MKSVISKITIFIAILLFLTLPVSCNSKDMQYEDVKGFRIRKVSDYPFYEMYYFEGYRANFTGLPTSAKRDFACSLFSAKSNTGEIFLGRNFDWDHSPALLLYTYPSEGYRSISMVNLDFLGITVADAEELLPLSDSDRQKLSRAPFLPTDGMNEAGLAVGMAAVPFSQDDTHPENPEIGSLGVIREMLDIAATVEEALRIMEKYTIDFGEGPPIHYLIADAKGDSAVVEYGSGKMKVIRNEGIWIAATNFLLEGAGDNPELMCDRFQKISEKLESSSGRITVNSGLDILSNVSQGTPLADGTQWSALYLLTKGELQLALGRDFENILTFSLD